jgi:hypothetical protein
LKFNIVDQRSQHKVTLQTLQKGITMNEDLAQYLIANTDLEVNVTTL